MIGFLGACFLSVQLLTADEIDDTLERRLKKVLDSYHQEKRLTSLSFSLFRGDRSRFDYAVGKADVFGKKSATPGHIYTWASVTKPVTALVVLHLIEQGRLALDDSVHHYIAGFPENLIIKDLLNHTTGFLREKENEHFLTDSSYRNILRYQPLQFRMKIHRYANFNYAALGTIIEGVTGRSYRLVVAEYFRNITGEDIFFHNHTVGATDGRFVENYVRRYRRLYAHTPVTFGLWEPAAFAQTTSPAMAEFLAAHLSPTVVTFLEEHAVRVDGYRDRNRQRSGEYYALGFRLRYQKGELEAIYHNGFLYGVISTFYYFPQKQIGFVAASNMSSYPRAFLTLGGLYKVVVPVVDDEFNRRVAEYTASHGYLKGAVYYETIKNQGELIKEKIAQAAETYLKQDQYREAISLFELNNYVFGDSPETYQNLAEAYMRSGYHELAVASLRKGLQVDPQLESLKRILERLSAK